MNPLGHSQISYLPELDPAILAACIEFFFPGGKAISRDTRRAYAQAFYKDLDLEARGGAWQAQDLAFFAQLADHARGWFAHCRAYRAIPPTRMLIVGCGTGRHAAS